MQLTPVREYRIAPMFCRCCWYVVIGFAMIASAAVWIKPLVPNRGLADIVAQISLCALIASAMLLPLNWKLRLNRHGIARRLYFCWDFWAWSEFASGRMRKLASPTLYDPERPWWRRRLGLNYLESSDRHKVLTAINAHYVLPPPPKVPNSLTLRYGFRRQVTFDDKGIHLLHKNVPRGYLWGELRYVHMTRLDPLRRDFRQLTIALPDDEIELKLLTHQGGTSPNWRGATAEEINEFLFAHIPRERIEVRMTGEPLRNREYIRRKLKDSQRQLRSWRMIMAIMSLLWIGCLAWAAIDEGLFRAALMSLPAIPIVPVLVYMDRDQCRQIAELGETLDLTSIIDDENP